MYDPDNLRVESVKITVQAFLSKLGPVEGRLGWSQVKQSQYIESLLVRVPPTPFWVDRSGVDNCNAWAVLDGRSRVKVLRRFLHGKLTLQGLELFTVFNGRTESDLWPGHRRRLQETLLTVNTINPGTTKAIRDYLVSKL